MPMNRLLSCTVMVIAVTLASTSSLSAASDPHRPIRSANASRQAPVWVPAETAFDDHGAVTPGLFIRNEIQPQLARAATASSREVPDAASSGCDGVTVYEDFGTSAPGATLEALSREAS